MSSPKINLRKTNLKNTLLLVQVIPEAQGPVESEVKIIKQDGGDDLKKDVGRGFFKLISSTYRHPQSKIGLVGRIVEGEADTSSVV